MKTKCLFVLALFLCIAGSSQRPNSGLNFVGNFTYNFNNEFETGTIKLPKISNKRNGGNSGTLLIEVWLMENKYYGSLKSEGFLLFDKKLEPLKGGWDYNNLKYDFDWKRKVPKGSYYVVFMLSEYSPKNGINYALADFLCFDTKFVVTGKPDYDAFWDDL